MFDFFWMLNSTFNKKSNINKYVTMWLQISKLISLTSIWMSWKSTRFESFAFRILKWILILTDLREYFLHLKSGLYFAIDIWSLNIKNNRIFSQINNTICILSKSINALRRAESISVMFTFFASFPFQDPIRTIILI